MDVYLNNKRLRLSPSSSIGKGGEADIFDLGGGVALKLWKGPDHADFAGCSDESRAAEERLSLAQHKMPLFPSRLPERVAAPMEWAMDKKGQTILGYTMRLVEGAEALMSLGEPNRRRALGGDAAARILCDLWKTVAAVHAAGVVMGDFNDLNVLVRETEAHIVDADSFQFGGFPCAVFTERFLDPRLCDVDAARPTPILPFDANSDWYAFAVMAMTTLLCVGPFGGVFRPKNPSRRVPEPMRPLRRITVFDPEVRYPKPAIPYGVLPDDLLHAFSSIFERGASARIPLEMLESLRFVACIKCGAEHARSRCPECDHGVPREVVVIRGNLKATRRFSTTGTIVFATIVGDEPAYVYHEGNCYRREDGSLVVRGPLDGLLRFWIQGQTTYVGRGSRVLAIRGGKVEEHFAVDTHEGEPIFGVNERYRFHVHGGRLFRRAARSSSGPASLGDELWGDVLAGQTRIWVGERLGFGYYRAGSLAVAFTFDTERRGLRDTVRIPWPAGRIIAAEAEIDEKRIWFFLVHLRAGRVIHQAAVIGPDGAVLGVASGEPGDGTWLGSIGGKNAIGGALFNATSGGLVRVELGPNGPEETRRFADTEPFVNEGSKLLAGRSGLFAVDSREITMLAMG